MARGKYLTPDAPVGDDTVWKAINLHIAPVEIQALFSGALTELYQAWLFDQFGDMTPEETAQYYLERPFVDDICIAIADCINSGVLDEALASANGRNQGKEPIDGSNKTDLDRLIEPSTEDLKVSGTCDLGFLFGAATAIADYLNAALEQTFQAIETATNAIEAFAIIGDDVPLLGQSLDMINWLTETAAEEYLTSYTTDPDGTRDVIRCAIFCLMKDDCELTFDELYNKFLELSGLTLPPTPTMADFISVVTALVSGDAIVYGSHALIMALIATGASWLGFDSTGDLSTVLQLGLNDNDPDYLILCDDCAPPPTPCDFPMALINLDPVPPEPCVTVVNGAVALADGTNWQSSTPSYVVSNASSAATFGARITVDLPSVQNSLNVAFKLSVSTGNNASPTVQWLVRAYDVNDALLGENFIQEVIQPTTTDEDRTVAMNFVGMDWLQITAVTSTASGISKAVALHDVRVS